MIIFYYFYDDPYLLSYFDVFDLLCEYFDHIDCNIYLIVLLIIIILILFNFVYGIFFFDNDN